MSELHPPWLQPLSEAFNLGTPKTLSPLQSGLIQQTWQLETHQGRFICQQLHPAFAKEVTEDAQVISQFLRDQGFPIPQYFTTSDGELHLDWEGRPLRVMDCLPGITHAKAPEKTYLHQAGLMAGKLHKLLSNLEHQFKFQLPYFHDTKYIFKTLQTIADDPETEAEIDFFRAMIPDLLLPDDLPRQVIHGDLKLSNFLFDTEGICTGLVDLDTFMVHNLYVEMGDALRSWCTVGHHFDLETLASGLQGYADSQALQTLESELLAQGIQLIVLELGMRYLKDYFEDCYFQWDRAAFPSRKDHNLARCRRQIAVFQSIQSQKFLFLQCIHQAFRTC
jgi:Ser/Thr protein kinase RdoA (MazF antagonist)